MTAGERPDGWQPSTDDGGPTDGFFDAPYPGDVAVTGDTDLRSCSIHHDCAQGDFCYKGTCLRDNKQAVYHYGKPGCPFGHWCLAQSNAKDDTYVCQDACDCGPAHCCLNNRCVRDLADPWITGPVVGTSPPGS